MINLLLITIVSIAFSSNLASAAFSEKDIGTTSGQVLKLGGGARPAGMGEAFVGIADDANAVYWNPAGLNQLERTSVSVMHAVWFEDISYDWVSYAYPFANGGAFGLGVQYLNYGKIQGTDNTGLENASFKPYDLATTVAYGGEFYGMSAGISLKYLTSRIKRTARAYAGDLGLMHKLLDDRLSIGLALQNIGTKLKYIEEGSPLPRNIKVGGAYKIRRNWLFAVDLNAPVDNQIHLGVGSEYNFQVDGLIFSGRVGYKTLTKEVAGFQGMSAGLGVRYADNGFADDTADGSWSYSLDYSFVPYGDLGNTHRVSFGIKF